MSDQKKAPTPSEIADPRYAVQPSQEHSYAIIDTTGHDEPYTIDAMRSLSRYEREELLPTAIQRYEEYNRTVAEDWAYTWNLVELGYCGSCKKPLAEQPGHEGERYPAVGYNNLYRVLCFSCACSQE